MRTSIFALLAGLMMTGAANADIIEILSIDPAAGTRSGFTITATNADTFSFTGTSDFDGGGVDDTLAFTLTRSTFNASGAAIAENGDVTIGAATNGGNNVNWFSNFGDLESIQLEVSDIAYTSGEADGTTAVFNGFVGVDRVNITATDAIDFFIHTDTGAGTGSTTVTPTNGGTNNNTVIDLTSVGASETVFITAEDGSGGIRLRDLDLRFETVAAASVPEPTSSAVLLGGLSMMVMRRRRS